MAPNEILCINEKEDVIQHNAASTKFSPVEWSQHNIKNKNKCISENRLSEKLRQDVNDAVKFTDSLTNQKQELSTRRIKERLGDIIFWKRELEREIRDLTTENAALLKEKRRLEPSLLTTEFVTQIAIENYNCRMCRSGIDNVSDAVDLEIPRELELINDVQEILKKTIEQTETQIHRNRSIKEAMECNWSDKKEAEEYDTIAGVLNNGSTNKQFYSNVAKYQNLAVKEYKQLDSYLQRIVARQVEAQVASVQKQINVENMSSPEQWAQVSHDVIVRSEAERLTSEDLRGLITQLLKDISRDLIQKSDTICVEFQKNIDRLECAKMEQEQQLKQILKEVLAQERCINQLNEAIKAKDDPLKVVQTRLHMQEFRPNMELCKDPPQASLIAEADMLAESLAILSSEKERAENKLKELQNLQMNLEKEIQLKEETIRIDKIQCLPRRQAYPSREQLQGYT